MTISQTASDARARARQGFVGQLAAYDRHTRELTVLNQDPQAVQVSTVTVSGATNDKTYSLVLNGVTVSYTSDGTATIAEIAQGLSDAIDAEPAVRGQIAPSATATTVVLTGTTAGQAFTATESDAELSIALTTAAASAAPIPFGRLVVDTGDAHPDSGQTPLGKLAKVTAFGTQTSTLTVTYAASHTYTVQVENAATGELLAVVRVAADTDDDTTATNIEAALAAALPANTVDESVATNVVTLSSEVDGFEFRLSAFVEGGGAGAIVQADTTPASKATSLYRAALGMSEWSRNEEAAAIGDTTAAYKANHGFIACQRGLMYVDRPGAITAGGDVWVELADGDDSGKLFTSGSSTRVKLPGLTWELDARTTTDDTATVRIDLF